MSPRTPTHPPEAVLAATLRMMKRHGADLTLAHVGAELGLTAARVGKVFGSKEALLAAAAEHWVADSARQLRAAADVARPPLTALIDGYARFAREAAAGPEFLRVMEGWQRLAPRSRFEALQREYVRAIRAFTLDRLQAARDRGDLSHPKLGALADFLMVVHNGAYLTWVLTPSDSLEVLVRRMLGAALAPYRVVRPRSRR